ncbi:MFS transporter [Longispora sp. K20-0274]|uniref:MFS transporter n=1 Tax=Longispora sp. K20-0274 TaxID=3088255 RepID=UPI00399BF59C
MNVRWAVLAVFAVHGAVSGSLAARMPWIADHVGAGPGRLRWAVLAVFAVHGAVSGSLAARMPWIADHVGAGPGRLGVALTMPAIGAMAAMPFTGRLVARLGGRRATRLLLAAWSAVLVLPALAPNLVTLCGALLLAGVCAGMSDMAMNAEGVAVEKLLGRPIMSGLHGGWSVGGLLAGGLGALLARAGVDARAHFALLEAALVVLGLAATRRLPSATAAASAPFALPRGIVLAIALVGFCACFAEVATADWSAVYLVRVLGADQASGAGAYAGFAAAMTLGRLTGDAVVHRYGPVGTTRVAGAFGTLGGLLVVLSAAPWVAVVGFALIGLGIATMVPLVFSAAGRTGQGTHAIASVATVAYGAGLAAPGVVGGLADATSLTVSFAVITALVAVVALSARVLRFDLQSG